MLMVNRWRRWLMMGPLLACAWALPPMVAAQPIDTPYPFTARVEDATGTSLTIAGRVNATALATGQGVTVILEVQATDAADPAAWDLPATLTWVPRFTAQGAPASPDGEWRYDPLAPPPSPRAVPRPMQASPTQPRLREDGLSLRLAFHGPAPSDDGIYQLILELDQRGPASIIATRAALPFVLKVGEAQGHPVLGLLDGQLLSVEARQHVVPLADLWLPDRLVLPPGPHAFVPRLMDLGLPPLSGTIRLTVEAPDGHRIRLPASAITLDGSETTISSVHYGQVPLDRYGEWRAELTGELTDPAGQRFAVRDTYIWRVAEPLSLLRIPAGLPLAAGQPYLAGLATNPPLAGTLIMRLRSIDAEGHIISDETLRFPISNRGIATADALPTQPGTLIVDAEVLARDADDRLWAAAFRDYVVTHAVDSATGNGWRGVPGYERSPQAWFDTAIYPYDDPYASRVVRFPYYHGDLVILAPGGEGIILGEAADTGGFVYQSISRLDGSAAQSISHPRWPDVRVWSPADEAGPDAWALTISGPGRGAYAALALRDDTAAATRVTPPFGVFGGTPIAFADDPDATALRVLPMSPRPGDDYPAGSYVPVAALVWPPVAASYDLTITDPRGEALPLAFGAAPTGYGGTAPVALATPGFWRFHLAAAYDGPVSAGPLPAAVTGQVAGTDPAGYTVYVTSDTAPLTGDLDPTSGEVLSANGRTWALDVPQGWADVTAHWTVATVERVLIDVPLAVLDGAVGVRLAAGSAPDGASITIGVQGVDALGQRALRVQRYTIRDGRIYVGGT
jgi:hypothetical protein